MHQLGFHNFSEILQTPIEIKKYQGRRNDSPVVGQILSAVKGKPVEKRIEILKENVRLQKKIMTRSYSKNMIKKIPTVELK